MGSDGPKHSVRQRGIEPLSLTFQASVITTKVTVRGYNITIILLFRYRLQLRGRFTVELQKPTSWTHIVLHFNSSIFDANSVDERVFTVYHDGESVGSTSRDSRGRSGYSEGDGRIAIGRRLTVSNKQYASVKVDELKFFNRMLTEAEITILFNA